MNKFDFDQIFICEEILKRNSNTSYSYTANEAGKHENWGQNAFAGFIV